MNKMNIKKKLVAFVSTVVLMALVVVCLGLLLVKVCSGTDEWKEVRIEPVVGSAAKDSVHVVHYTRPEIPQVMTEPADRAAYYVKHYWDDYLVDDTAWVNGMDTEQLYADFGGKFEGVVYHDGEDGGRQYGVQAFLPAG